MSVWRFTASAICLLVCSSAASAAQLHSHASLHHKKIHSARRLATTHRHHLSSIRGFQTHRRQAWSRDDGLNTEPNERLQPTLRDRHLREQPHRETAWFNSPGSYGNSGYAYASPGYSGRAFTGAASYYSRGRRTANGQSFDPNGFTAAHRTLPFGTRVSVTDLISGRCVVVTITDRGPFVRGRVLDLARGAAQALGMTGRGVTRIRATVI